MGSILERTTWVDTSIDLLIHEIIEYDMKDGGLSIIKEEGLLPPSMIQKLDKLKKGIDRNAAIGKLKYSKKYSEVPKMQNELFKKYRLLFGEQNDLVDEDIQAIRKDAIFVKRFCYNLDIGTHIHFAEKNLYQIYVAIESKVLNGKNRVEFYWKDDGWIDVKGIEDKIINAFHREYTLKVISMVLRYIYRYDYKGAIKYLSRFLTQYKQRTLEAGYYRTFDAESIFPVIEEDGRQVIYSEMGPDRMGDLDISFNYMKVYVPLIKVLSS